MTERSRECFLDRLRVLATCAVVMLHTVTGVMDNMDMSAYPLEWTVFLVAMDWLIWCVPIFVMISGYLFLAPDREITFRQILTKYCRRIVLALFLFGVPYACLELSVQGGGLRAEMLWQAVVMVLTGRSWSHMWYLYLILLLYLVTPALRFVLAKMPRLLIYLLLAILFAGGSIMPFIGRLQGRQELAALPDNSIYLFYYICGYLFHGRKRPCGSIPAEERQETHGRRLSGNKHLPPASLYSLALICLLLFGMAVSRVTGFAVRMAYNYPVTVVLSLMIMRAAGEWEPYFRGKHADCWRNISSLTFTIYLIHPVFVNICYKFLHVTPLDYPLGISLPLFFLVILLLSAAGSRILFRIPVLRRYVL